MTADERSKPRTVKQIRPGDHVVVIGAGPAGLTAAYELAYKTEARITVLEGDSVVGGISRTVQYNGFRFDLGGHRFFTKIGPVQRLWKDILGPEFIKVPRLSRIFYNGKYFDYPLKPMNALTGLGLWNAFLIVASYIKWHYRPYPVEENFEQWVTNRFGRRLYLAFFKTYTEKVWGLPCTEIRAEWAAQRIQGLSLARAVLNASNLNKRSNDIKTLIHEFDYPRLGPGQMWESCRARIEQKGHQVLMEHRVRQIVLNDGQVQSVVASTPGGDRTFAADHVIGTMPLRSLVRSLTPKPPPEAAAAAEGLSYRDFLVVALMIRREKLFPDNWIYIHTPGVKVGRIQNFNNWSAAMVPEPGITCVGMEYFCFKGDGLWSMADADLAKLAATELQSLGLATASDVVDASVVRVPKAYPIYDSVYRDHITGVRALIDPIPNLHTVGRNGMHKYNNQDHSMLTAMMTVDNMRGASHDVWAVNTDFDYHEEQRVDPRTLPDRRASPMRIGVDATCWANERGYGRFTRELVGAMAPATAHELVCFLDDRSAEAFRLDCANVTRRLVPQAVSPTLAASSGSRRSIGDMLKMGNAVRRERVDAFFSPSVYGYFPLPPGLPAVVTIHDAIAERFPALTLPTRMDRWSWRAKVRLAIFQARLILTVSEYAAREVATHLGVAASRLRVAVEGVSDVFRPSESPDAIRAAANKLNMPSGARWLTYVGGFGPHKHVDLIVRAHAEAARLNPGTPLILVLAGPNQDGFHADVAGIREAIRECGTESLVRWAGFLPDEELRHLHSGAVALLLVSASEGFGLPAVEAAMCGAPVVATLESPLPQLLEGGGVFIAPGDVTAITDGINRLLADEPARASMGRRARERAQELSWARAATVALGALEEVAAPRRKVA